MKLATTTGDFKRWCKTNIERLDCISESGFRYVDLNMYADTENPELFFADNWKENVIKIKNHAENSGLTFVQAHAPGINPFLPHVDYNHFVDITKRAIEISGMLGIKNLVVHGGIVMDSAAGKEMFTEKNIKFLSELFPLIEEYNVNLLYENSSAKELPGLYYLVTGKDMTDFIKAVGHPLVHACWDTGHANLDGHQYNNILDIGKELYALHVNDNSGNGDEHTLPYLGIMNMDELMHALIDVGYNGYFTFEAVNCLRFASFWQGDRREFDSDTRALEPQLFMRKTLEKLLYEIGEYVLRKYNVFEE